MNALRRLLLLLGLLGLSATAVTPALSHRRSPANQGGGGGPWADSNYQRRVKVTIDSAQVGSTLTDFPVYVRGSDLPATFFANVQADGDDVRAYDDDHSTEFDIEMVAIDTGGSTAEIYVEVSSLSSTVDTDFYLYYDYGSATAYGSPTGVWNSGFKAVWHLEGANAAGTTDSTANGHDAYNDNSSPTYQSTGKVGYGVAFDGVDDWIQFLDHDDFSPFTQQTFTVEVWAKFDVDSAHQSVVNKINTNNAEWSVHYLNIANRRLGWTTWTTGGSFHEYTDDGSTIATGQWYHMAAKIADAHQTTSTQNFVLDGADQTNYTASNTNSLGNGTTNVRIGLRGDNTWPFDGVADEVRISDVVRSDDWLSATYININTPTTFYTVGSEETQ